MLAVFLASELVAILLLVELRGGEAKEDVGLSPGEIPSVRAGKKKTLAVSLKPGKYVIICNLPGHYKAG